MTHSSRVLRRDGGGGFVDCLDVDVDVVVDMVVIGINNLIRMSACSVTSKVCECYIGNP